jgi:pentatricopeptide repeat protein
MTKDVLIPSHVHQSLMMCLMCACACNARTCLHVFVWAGDVRRRALMEKKGLTHTGIIFLPSSRPPSLPASLARARSLSLCLPLQSIRWIKCEAFVVAELHECTTGVAYNLMIRGYGKRGNFNDALRMSERMASEGLQLTQDTMSGLMDAQLLIDDLDGCMRLVDTMQKSYY